MTSTFSFGNYDALEVKAEKRLLWLAVPRSSYVWSHAYGVGNTPLSGNTSILDQILPVPYTNASWDIRQNFSPPALITNCRSVEGGSSPPPSTALPICSSAAGRPTALLRCEPASPTPCPEPTATASGASECRIMWLATTAPPTRLPRAERTPSEFFNINNYTVAYSNQAAGIVTGGNVGPESPYGPHTDTVDFSVFKNFKLTEKFNLQFRGEAINLFNFAVLNTPDASLGDSKALGGNGLFGQITSSVAGTERHLQFSLRFWFCTSIDPDCAPWGGLLVRKAAYQAALLLMARSLPAAATKIVRLPSDWATREMKTPEEAAR